MVRHELGVNFMAPQKCHIMGPVKVPVTDRPRQTWPTLGYSG